MILYTARATLADVFGDRLMVGQRPLKPLIGVRAPVPEPERLCITDNMTGVQENLKGLSF